MTEPGRSSPSSSEMRSEIFVRDRVGGGEQNRVGGVDIAAGDRAPLVADERRDRRFGIAEIARERRKAVAQDMRRHVGGQGAEFRDARPILWKSGHAGRRRARPETRDRRSALEAAQHVAGCSRERPHRFAGLRVGERRGAAREVDFNPAQRQRLAAPESSQSDETRRGDRRRPERVASAFRSASPSWAYSSSERRRSRFRSAKSATPRTGLSGRMSFRTA